MDLKTDLYISPSYKNGTRNTIFKLTGTEPTPEGNPSFERLSKLVAFKDNQRRNIFFIYDKLNIYGVLNGPPYQVQRSLISRNDLGKWLLASVAHFFPFRKPTYKIKYGNGKVLYQTEEDNSNNIPKVLVKDDKNQLVISVSTLQNEQGLRLEYTNKDADAEITVIIAMLLYSHFYPKTNVSLRNMCARKVTVVACIVLLVISLVLIFSCAWFPSGEYRATC